MKGKIMQQSQGKRYYANQTAEIDRHIGKRIKISRRAAGLTQMKLAEKLGMTFQQIQKYEMGKNRVSSAVLWQISNIFGVSIEFFFEGLNSVDKAENNLDEMLHTNESISLIRNYYRIKNRRLAQSLFYLFENLAHLPTITREDVQNNVFS